MFDRIANSWSMTLSSLRLLRDEKSLVIFPILSGICCLLVIASFCVPFLANPQILDFPRDANGDVQVPLWVYPVLFAFYFCNYFVVIFFNSALIGAALLRFNGEEITLKDGLSIAGARLPQILAWALVSATVGFILKLIESAHEKVGEFVSSLLGTAWSIITYFVVPVLVVEKVGPVEAVQRSLALLKKSWGEALVGHVSIGLIMFLFLLPAIAVFVLGIMMLQQMVAVGVALMVLAGIYFLVWSAVGPAVNGIFLAALYQYATTGQVPNGFEQHAMAGAFAPKK
jgi:uncharacterized protein DUF6159